MSNTTSGDHRARRRFLPLIWAASALSAAVLVLGVSGTLSSWTQAVITNSTNTVATANAVILKETSGASTCYSTDGTANDNTFTCGTINKYGGTAVPLVPGGSQSVTVVFTNAGKKDGASFKLAPSACSQLPVANAAATPPINNLCTATGELSITATCSDGATYSAAGAWTDLAYAAGPAGAMTTKTHVGSATSLTAGSSWTCVFTASLASGALVTDQGIVLSQPLVWTLA